MVVFLMSAAIVGLILWAVKSNSDKEYFEKARYEESQKLEYLKRNPREAFQNNKLKNVAEKIVRDENFRLNKDEIGWIEVKGHKNGREFQIKLLSIRDEIVVMDNTYVFFKEEGSENNKKRKRITLSENTTEQEIYEAVQKLFKEPI